MIESTLLAMEKNHADENTQQSSLFEPKIQKHILRKEEIDFITEVEEDTSPMCALKNHFWRDAYLKTEKRTKHIIYCTHCTRTKFNEDGTVQDWLLKQGYIKAEDGSDEQVTDFGYGKI